MTNTKTKTRAKSGQTRILEAVVAALIIFIVFAASSFFINSSRTTAVQERADLDRLGHNVLNRVIESGTIESTKNQPALLRAFLQNSLPQSVLFNLTITEWTKENSKEWPTPTPLTSVSNSDGSSFLNSAEVSSTPVIYTSKEGEIYYLVLALANAGQGT